MLLQAINHIVPGVCKRSPASEIFSNPSANPPSDNPTTIWPDPDPDSQLKSRASLRFVGQTASKLLDIRLIVDISRSETIDRQLQ